MKSYPLVAASGSACPRVAQFGSGEPLAGLNLGRDRSRRLAHRARAMALISRPTMADISSAPSWSASGWFRQTPPLPLALALAMASPLPGKGETESSGDCFVRSAGLGQFRPTGRPASQPASKLHRFGPAKRLALLEAPALVKVGRVTQRR